MEKKHNFYKGPNKSFFDPVLVCWIVILENKKGEETGKLLLDEFDFKFLRHLRFSNHGSGYVQHNSKNGRFFIHRKVLNAKKGQICDHINGNRLDNRRCNLRFVTAYQNSINRERSKTTGTWFSKNHVQSGKPWVAEIKHKYKKISLGYYKTQEEAHEAYKHKALELRGNEWERANEQKDIPSKDALLNYLENLDLVEREES